MRLLLTVEPADFRRQIDGLARMCRVELDSDPMSVAVFACRNRRATAIKLLCFDSQGKLGEKGLSLFAQLMLCKER